MRTLPHRVAEFLDTRESVAHLLCIGPVQDEQRLALREQAKAEVLPTLATRWEQLLKLAKPDDMAQSSSYAYLKGTFDAAVRGDLTELMDLGMLLIGSPETCIRLIKRHQEFLPDLQYMILFFAYGSLSQQQVSNSMRLFAEEVMPEFTDAGVGKAAVNGYAVQNEQA